MDLGSFSWSSVPLWTWVGNPKTMGIAGINLAQQSPKVWAWPGPASLALGIRPDSEGSTKPRFCPRLDFPLFPAQPSHPQWRVWLGTLNSSFSLGWMGVGPPPRKRELVLVSFWSPGTNMPEKSNFRSRGFRSFSMGSLNPSLGP